jgi:hypothetical protein
MKSKYKQFVSGASRIVYPESDNLTTDQSRSIAPAWMYRDLPQVHAYILPENPQSHTEMKFRNNVSTRNFEKDNFSRDNVCPTNSQDYTKYVKNQNQPTNANSKEGFSNIMPNVGKNTNIEYARRQFDAINGTQRRHV